MCGGGPGDPQAVGSRWVKGFHPRTFHLEGGEMDHSPREIWEADLEDRRRVWPWGESVPSADLRPGTGLSRHPPHPPQHTSLCSFPIGSLEDEIYRKGSVGGPVCEQKRTGRRGGGGAGRTWVCLSSEGACAQSPPHSSQEGPPESHCHRPMPQFEESPWVGVSGVGWGSSGQGPNPPTLGYSIGGERKSHGPGKTSLIIRVIGR